MSVWSGENQLSIETMKTYLANKINDNIESYILMEIDLIEKKLTYYCPAIKFQNANNRHGSRIKWTRDGGVCIPLPKSIGLPLTMGVSFRKGRPNQFALGIVKANV